MPTLALRNAVKSNIEDATSSRPSRKPLGVNQINYISVTPKDVSINVIGSDYTIDEKTDIFDYVKLKLSEIRPFVASIDVVEDKNSTLNAYKIGEMIANTIPNKFFTNITFTVGGVAQTNYEFLNGDIPKLTTITYA